MKKLFFLVIFSSSLLSGGRQPETMAAHPGSGEPNIPARAVGYALSILWPVWVYCVSPCVGQCSGKYKKRDAAGSGLLDRDLQGS